MKHLILLACLVAATASAQPAADAESELERFPVVVDGRSLFYVRGIVGRPAKERAELIEDRIVAAARNPELEPAQVRTVDTTHSTQILAGQQLLMTVSNPDAEIEQLDRPTMARAYTDLIAKAITTYRFERQPERQRRALVKVLVATGVFAALFALVVWATRRLGNWLEQRLRPKLQTVRLQSIELIPGAMLWNIVAMTGRGARLVMLLLLTYLYAQFSFSQFPGTRAIGEKLLTYLIDPLQTMGSRIVDGLPSLLFLLVLFIVVRVILRTLSMYFNAIGTGAVRLSNFAPEWSVPTYRLIRLAVIAFALVVAYPHIPGSGSDAFKGLSIFFGVLLSIGSSSFVANSVAGYALIYRRLFKAGDRVRIGEAVGDVIEMRMQVTRLRTVKNEEIIIPNSTILNSMVVNYSAMVKDPGLILHTTVGIGYETPWRQVEGMLLMAAERTTELLKDPPPFVLQKSLGDFCVTYELNAYTSSAEQMAEKYHALHANIQDVFNEYGVQIMTPAYERDPPEPKVVPKERWYEEPSRPPAKGGGER
jgi:small-conductance mechanosensitive channel